MSSFYTSYIGRGVGDSTGNNQPSGMDIFSQIWGSISSSSASGASTAGQIASALLAAGYSAATISALLNNVSQVADVTPQMIAAAQQEQVWLQQYNRKTNWPLLLGIGALILWAASRKN